jgi:hypothetical protein
MPNPSLNIAWSIAEIEASAAGFEAILQNHFWIGCCKGCDLDCAKFLEIAGGSANPVHVLFSLLRTSDPLFDGCLASIGADIARAQARFKKTNLPARNASRLKNGQ